MAHQVGIREFKAKLSHYLRMASRGEQVTITDRGKPLVTINPAPQEHAPDPLERAIWKLVAEGKASWSGGKPKGLRPRVKLLGGPSMAQTIIEGREE